MMGYTDQYIQNLDSNLINDIRTKAYEEAYDEDSIIDDIDRQKYAELMGYRL
jgi:hypothetical protein